jgi:hypothetical protein
LASNLSSTESNILPEYDSRYKFMMETINKIVFQKLDHRVLEYLHERIRRSGTDAVKVSTRRLLTNWVLQERWSAVF